MTLHAFYSFLTYGAHAADILAYVAPLPTRFPFQDRYRAPAITIPAHDKVHVIKLY